MKDGDGKKAGFFQVRQTEEEKRQQRELYQEGKGQAKPLQMKLKRYTRQYVHAQCHRLSVSEGQLENDNTAPALNYPVS